MTRNTGVKAKAKQTLPHYATLAPKDRIKFLAALIVERILQDQTTGGKLIKQVEKQSHARPIQT